MALPRALCLPDPSVSSARERACPSPSHAAPSMASRALTEERPWCSLTHFRLECLPHVTDVPGSLLSSPTRQVCPMVLLCHRSPARGLWFLGLHIGITGKFVSMKILGPHPDPPTEKLWGTLSRLWFTSHPPPQGLLLLPFATPVLTTEQGQ